tara:strand:+ start:221 stop:502 length:282 start_codon:yes stop_codon:yes gene_type:complete
MKRKFEEDDIEMPRKRAFQQQVLVKRKPEMVLEQSSVKKRRQNSDELDALRKSNFELQQMCDALIHKVQTLEYMLQMFRQKETTIANRMVSAF